MKKASWSGCLVVLHKHPDIASAIARMFNEKLPGLRVKPTSRLKDIPHLAMQHNPIVVWIDTNAPVEERQWLQRFKEFCPALCLMGFTVDNLKTARLELKWEKHDLLYSNPIPWVDLMNYFSSKGMMYKTIQSDFHEDIQLTRRQLQLLNLLETGKSNEEISKNLQITDHTVKVHFWRLFKRLGVKNRLQALHKAKQLGLIMQPSDDFDESTSTFDA